MDSKWYDILVIVSEWNIEGSYPDCKLKIYKRATDEYVLDYSKQIAELINLLKTNFL